MLALGLDTVAQAGEAVLVVGLVEDQVFRLHETEVVERGDHTL